MSVQPPSHAALLFALGPVQDFIATARKGQDLWFGSWLLSDLARAAATVAKDTPGVALIFPEADSLATAAVANKILLRAPVADAPEIAARMEQAVHQRLRQLFTDTFDKLDDTWLHREAAEKQLADVVEIYWVAVDEVGGWAEARRRAEAALAARKTLRGFTPVTWGAPVPKSRLDGQRESVIDERAFDKLSAEQLRGKYGIGPSERLCGVALLKRNGHRALANREARGKRVLSTAHLASWSFRRAWSPEALAKLPNAEGLLGELRALADAWLATLPDDVKSSVPREHTDPVLGNVDGQVLYAGRLGETLDGSELRAATGRLDAFVRDCRAKLVASGLPDPGAPNPYYAVLRADGDSMGAWFDRLPQPGEQAAASKALARFAAEAETIVHQHHGDCVFAGGDDVLALLPVQTALDCALALRDAFANAVANETTLSVGIHIAHATDPFRDALDGARAAEHAAKHIYGRDAWAVTLDKRSGAPVQAGGKWGEQAKALRQFQALQTLQERGTGALPRGLAHDLRDAAGRLHVAPGADDATLAPLRALEVKRILSQKEIPDEARPAVLARLADPVLGESLRGLSNELIITRALAGLDQDAQ